MIKMTSNLALVSTFELDSLSNQGWTGKQAQIKFFYIILHTSVHWLSSIGNLCVGEKALNVFFFTFVHQIMCTAQLGQPNYVTKYLSLLSASLNYEKMQININKKVIINDKTLFVIRPSVAIMTVLISICTAKEETSFWIQRIGYNIFQHLIIRKE